MAFQLTKPLIVPEYTSGRIELYVGPPATPDTVPLLPYAIDLHDVYSSLLPGKTPAANACALQGDDLFVTNNSLDSQGILKFPNYLGQGKRAGSQAFVFTSDDSDYVGLAFDTQGRLFAAQGKSEDNHVFMYTGTTDPLKNAPTANNYATKSDLGNAGETSYFANLAFDGAGNLWVTDYRNNRVVAFDGANLGSTNTYHILNQVDGPLQVNNNDPTLAVKAEHLFASPEGLDFDGESPPNLWVANNNDGGGGVQNTRTSLVSIPPALQAKILATAPNSPLPPPVAAGTDFFIYQVPNLADDAGARPQFGGLRVDRAAGHLYVNEQVAGNGRGYDIATIKGISTTTADNDLDIVSTNPGNGGIATVDKRPVVILT